MRVIEKYTKEQIKEVAEDVIDFLQENEVPVDLAMYAILCMGEAADPEVRAEFDADRVDLDLN